MKNGVRVGAAAFVMGLSLAGPHGVGVATAETGEGESSAVSAGPAKSPAASAARASAEGASTSRAGRRANPAGDARSAAPVSTPADSTGPTARRAPGRTTTTEAVSAAPAAPAAVVIPPTRAASPSSGSTVSSEPVAPAARSPQRRAVITPIAPVPTPAASVATPSAVDIGAAAAIPAWAKAVAQVPVNPISTVLTGVETGLATFVTGLQNLLANPGNPVEFLEGALLLVRRSFFNQTPTTRPGTYLVRVSGQTEGTVGAVDPEGDALTYSLVSGTRFGTVQITDDGDFAYTPGEGYTGTDAFTVSVANPGFNLLDPFASRVQTVTVQAGAPTPRAGNPSVGGWGDLLGHDIYNFTGQQLIVRDVEADRDWGVPVKPKVGLVVNPGDYVHLEIFLYRLGNDVSVMFGSREFDDEKWDVFIDGGATSCTQGNCIGGTGLEVFLLEEPLSGSYLFPQGSAWGQQLLASILNSRDALGDGLELSYADATIQPKVVQESDYTYTGQRFFNSGGNETFGNEVNVAVTSRVTKTSGWEFSAGAEGTILKLIDVAVAAKYTAITETSEERTFSETRRLNGIPYSYNAVFAAAPQINVTGDLKATFGAGDTAVTYRFSDVDYSYPEQDPNQKPFLLLRTYPFQDRPNEGFLIKDAEAWKDPAFPLDPTYQVGDKPRQLITRAYVGATVAQAEDFTRRAQYTSSDPTVATVGESGLLTVLSPGVTRITATYAWNIEGDQRRRVEAFMDVTVT